MEIFAAATLFLAVSGWFWVILGVSAALFLGAVAEERGFFSTVTMAGIAALIAVRWPATVDFLCDPVNATIVAASYVVIGVLWSRFQWGKFLQRKVDHFAGVRDAFLKKHDLPADYLKKSPAPEYVEQYIEFMRDRIGSLRYSDAQYAKTVQELHTAITPSAASNKGALVMWIGYWPFSFTFYVLRDLLADFFNGVYRAVASQFQKVADRKFQQL